MLAAVLAILCAKGEDVVESVAFFASLHDFSDAGEIGLFVDEASVAAREAAIGKGGVMPGRDLAAVFSALRANDLIWSYVVNNYLKGRSPVAIGISVEWAMSARTSSWSAVIRPPASFTAAVIFSAMSPS